ncbi:hypothetical protein J5U18_12340 [Sphingobacteriaceae bacterium WQ 2009]|uniref:Surface antigen n=1 Tax=Rhinopithecimicrobium faecis TaxID=2820698 RepID=A0A8T4HBL8_9SPHI|nr:hypothetical protein [Sphingobacteriaceae bacterium WQ 2009]
MRHLRKITFGNLLFLPLLISYGGSVNAQVSDSIRTTIQSEYNKPSSFHRIWFGDSYRKLYDTEVTMPIMDLSKEKGGLSIVKLGGGMQTQSLRLVDSSGREWVLRSIEKFPERSLPENLRNTIAKKIVRDQIAIAHPFGALTVPTFNEALGIDAAKPELVYVGDDAALGEYRELFKNRAYIFESRNPEAYDDTDNTLKVQDKLEEDNDNQVDQRLTLRARLLDFVLGDWDRHEDNWRWSSIKEDGKRLYKPVPRDRDKVYFKTTGIFPILLSYQWLKASAQPFKDKIRNVGHWNFNQRYFDRYFLNHLSKADWDAEISYVQQQLTDSLIDVALAQMPPEIVALSAEELRGHIRARRDDLANSAGSYYQIIAQEVDIATSEKQEFIQLTYLSGGKLALAIYNRKKDLSKGRLLAARTFSPEETQELRIYGLGGKDVYTVAGDYTSPIKVRFIGGKDADSYTDLSAHKHYRNLAIYDDKSRDNQFEGIKNGWRKLSNDSTVYSYNRNSYKYDRTGILASFQYSPDRGVSFGAGYLIEKHGFRKEPYASRQEFGANYSTGRESFLFHYQGDFKAVWGKNDLIINLDAYGPNNKDNFFGLGNNTVFEERKERGIQYYRNRYDYSKAEVLLNRKFSQHWNVRLGSASEFFTIAASNNRYKYLAAYQLANPEEDIYGTYFFSGAKAELLLDTRDDRDNAKKGVFWQSMVEAKSELKAEAKQYLRMRSVVSFYLTDASDRFTFANRTGVEKILGDPLIYQYAQLGGENSLRGFNSKRFAGKGMVYTNMELRYKAFTTNSYILPTTVGVIGFYDVGRVWMPAETSKTWHMGYGGGLYLIPGDLLVLQAVAGFSKEGVRPYLSIGLRF